MTRRYITKAIIRERDPDCSPYVYLDYNFSPGSITVEDSVETLPRRTGILDQDGNEYYEVQEQVKCGFQRNKQNN